MHYTYIEWQLLLAWVPTLIVFLFFWRTLVRYVKVYIFCIAGSVLFAIPWDYWAIHSWLWHFSSELTINKHFLGLPLEEYLFFVSFTFLYVSIAIVLRQKMIKGPSRKSR
jgi:lycopene cyclase domain-containing protein